MTKRNAYEVQHRRDGRVRWRRTRWPDSRDWSYLAGLIVGTILAAWSDMDLARAVTGSVLASALVTVAHLIRRRWTYASTEDAAAAAVRDDMRADR